MHTYYMFWIRCAYFGSRVQKVNFDVDRVVIGVKAIRKHCDEKLFITKRLLGKTMI